MLPLGSVDYENHVNERGERYVWLPPNGVDRLGFVIGWHVEVQASFRPSVTSRSSQAKWQRLRTGSVLRLSRGHPSKLRRALGNGCTQNSRRETRQRREHLWPNVLWSYHLVHAVVREGRELEVFQGAKV